MVERRYSVRERTSSVKVNRLVRIKHRRITIILQDELKTCANHVGAQVLGLQTEVDKNVCENNDLKKNVLDNSRVERMVVSTYGSFLAESLADWSQQVVKLGTECFIVIVFIVCVNPFM